MSRLAVDVVATELEPAATPDLTLRELHDVFQRVERRHLPVIDSRRRVVGMVSQHEFADTLSSRQVNGTFENPARGTRVEEIMTRQVMTLEQADAPEEALRAMVAHGFHAVPLTEGGELRGMISGRDFLKEFSYGQWPGHDETVGTLVKSAEQVAEATDPLASVLAIAEQHDQEFVVVVRRNRPLGILSRTALRQYLLAETPPEEAAELQATPAHVLVPSLPPLVPDRPLREAAARMLEQGARALPVVDRARNLLGIVHEDDILRFMVERLDQEQPAQCGE